MKKLLLISLLLSGCGNKTQTTYFPDGKIKTEIQYNDTIMNGFYRKYYANGELNVEGRYVNGKREGMFNFFYENGAVWKRLPYKNNKPNGLFIEYHNNGKVKGIFLYKNGSLNGNNFTYYESGKLNEICELKNGKKISYERFNQNGSIDSLYRKIDITGNYFVVKAGNTLVINSKLLGTVKNSVIDTVLCYLFDYKTMPVEESFSCHSDAFTYEKKNISAGRYTFTINYVEKLMNQRIINHNYVDFEIKK